MIGVAQLLRFLSLRRLRARVHDVADLAGNPLRTVYPQEIVFDPACTQRIVVLAPHADDETFGAGGTLLRHVRNGDAVCVAVFSDNVGSIDAAGLSDEEKRALRSGEFAAAMNALGIADRRELQLDSARLHSGAGERILVNLLIEKEPHVLYLPWTCDNHEEHRIINVLSGRALRAVATQHLIVRGYEVWSAVPATAAANITKTIEEKRIAIRCYASQTDAIDYEHHILGLNAYRALTLGPHVRYAEAFLECTAREYLSLITRHLDH
jgi:LmbE family N-acetylglucosaminyl deacetylase